jgi:hypothetical protein
MFLLLHPVRKWLLNGIISREFGTYNVSLGTYLKSCQPYGTSMNLIVGKRQ